MTPAEDARSEARRDPLGPVLGLGRRQRRVGVILGIAGTLAVHGAPAGQAARSFYELRDFATRVRARVEDRLRSEVDVDLSQPPKPPPIPEPEPPPEPEPEQQRPQKASESPPEPAPPAPAQAGRLLTAEVDPDAPVDLTDEGFVTGTAERYVGGVTASSGASKRPVRNPAATPSGVPGGTGTAMQAPPPPPPRDLSRAPSVGPGRRWACGFPPEADLDNVNHALVTLTVTVGPDGRALGVTVLSDPGHGFGRWAKQCALRTRFEPGLDRYGKPATRTTPSFNIRFDR